MKLIPTILVSLGLGATPLLAADDAEPAAAAAESVPVTIVVASGGG